MIFGRKLICPYSNKKHYIAIFATLVKLGLKNAGKSCVPELELFLRVKQQGDRAIVHKGYVHHGLEFAGGHGDLSGADFVDELFVEVRCFCRWCRGGIGWSPSLATVAVQGELGNHQHLSVRFDQGEIHEPLLVIEDAEIGDLISQECGVLFRVVFANAEKNKKPRPDGAAELIVYANGGLAYPLHYGAHGIFS